MLYEVTILLLIIIARGGPKAVDPSFSHQLDRTLWFLHSCKGECDHEGTL